MTQSFGPGRRALVAIAALGAVAAWSSPAPAAVEILGDATYKAKGTEIVTAPDGSTVTINTLPVKIKCKGITPTNLGEDLGPFPIKKNGSFTNGRKRATRPGTAAINGKFSSNGKTVRGTFEEAKFKDPAKDFDCPHYKISWSAKLVKGTGVRAGEILARDDFTDDKSGFGTFNSTNSFGEYLKDGRYRVGLRGPGAAFALRDEPVASMIDVSATVRWFGNDELDGAGLVCQASGSGSFTVGFARGNGKVELKRYVDSKIFESATPATLPDGVLKSGQGEANELELTCIPDATSNSTHVELKVNGQVAARANTSSIAEGKTGFFVEDQAGGTDFNFEDYVAKVPERDS